MIGIIPAGGKGTRLRPITDFIPKELLMYGDKPFIGHCLESLRTIGLNRVCIIIGHKKGTIIDYVKDGSSFGLEVDYVYQREPKGLGHAILCADKKINGQDMFILLGDNVVTPYEELENLINIHKKENSFITILLEETEHPEMYGVVRFNGFDGKKGRILELFEKPTTTEEKSKFEHNGTYYAISGAYVAKNGLFDYLRITQPGRNNEIQLTDAIELALKDGKKVIGVLLKGKRVDIGNMEMYLRAQKEWFEIYL